MAASPSNTVLESPAEITVTDGTARENEDDNKYDSEGEGDVPVQSGLDESAAAAILATSTSAISPFASNERFAALTR